MKRTKESKETYKVLFAALALLLIQMGCTQAGTTAASGLNLAGQSSELFPPQQFQQDFTGADLFLPDITSDEESEEDQMTEEDDINPCLALSVQNPYGSGSLTPQECLDDQALLASREQVITLLAGSLSGYEGMSMCRETVLNFMYGQAPPTTIAEKRRFIVQLFVSMLRCARRVHTRVNQLVRLRGQIQTRIQRRGNELERLIREIFEQYENNGG